VDYQISSQLKDVYHTSGAAASGCFGPNAPQNKLDATLSILAHMFYNRGDRSEDLLDTVSDGQYSNPADRDAIELLCPHLLPDCRVGDQTLATCDVDAPLLSGRRIVATAEDASKKRRSDGGVAGPVAKRGGMATDSLTQLFPRSPPASQRSAPESDPFDRLTPAGGGSDYSILGERDSEGDEMDSSRAENNGNISNQDLSRLAFGAFGTGEKIGTVGTATVGLSLAVLMDLTCDEHPAVQHIMQTLAGLDYRVIPRLKSIGAMYAGLTNCTLARPKVGILLALVRPANWNSFDPRQPLTFDVMGGFEMSMARVETLDGHI
jgi:hypothetical protein